MTDGASYSDDDKALDGPFVFLDDAQTPAPRFYHHPISIIRADTADEVEDAFARLSQAHGEGYYLAGYISYELGLTFEPRLSSRLPRARAHPLLCFGVFKNHTAHVPAKLLYNSQPRGLKLTADWSEADYLKRFKTVQAYLRAGDCYQINLTFPMRGSYEGDPLALYASLRHRQQSKYGGFMRLGGPDLLSLSPELFFNKTGAHMSMRPMKGTVKRDTNAQKDLALRANMAKDSKSRAENLMIVDLLRNDLSRLSKAGSVEVPELFSLETYPTLHQMTSRVVSELKDGTSFRDLFQSLFPCGSVTGAPKIRAMEIIDELEDTPRGAYCGAMGFVDPDGSACFNVGIRTLSLSQNKAVYHVGSGVVLDSNGKDEYAECLLKADVLRAPTPYFIETLYWDKETGYRHIGLHLARLSKALNQPTIMENVIQALARYEPKHTAARIRLTADLSGHITLNDKAFTPLQTPLKLALSKYRLNAEMQTTAHKISARDFYDGERARLKSLYDVDEVIFMNEENALCEGSFTTLFIQKNKTLLTPHMDAGLLPGVFRTYMLETGKATESHVTQEDLKSADKLYVGNSLRGLIPAKLIYIESDQELTQASS